MDHRDLVQSQHTVKLRKHTFVIIHQIISGIVHMAGVKAYPESEVLSMGPELVLTLAIGYVLCRIYSFSYVLLRLKRVSWDP